MRRLCGFSVLLCALALPVNASAVIDPFTWALAGSLALHTSAAGVIARFRSNNGAVKPTSTGGAAMESTAVWVELVGMVPTIKTKAETSSIPYSTFSQLASASAFTPLQQAFFAYAPPVDQTGSVVQNPDTSAKYTLGAATYVSACYGGSAHLTSWFPSTTEYRSVTPCGAPGNVTYTTYTITATAAPVTTGTTTTKSLPDTLSALPAAVAGSPATVADILTASEALLTNDCGGAVWSNGDFVSISDCQPSPNPPNAITPAQQVLADTARTKLETYNAASTAYTASPTAGNATALNNARTDYNSAANTLNNSLGGSGIAPVAQVIGGTTTTPVSPSGDTPPGDPSAAPYGTATTPGGFGNYSGSSAFNVGNRFQSFFDQMKTTAVFSLPGQFSASIPAGGTSTMSFNGGRFGEHTFDFATFSGVFLVVKSIFMVVCAWVALKIVTKGGA